VRCIYDAISCIRSKSQTYTGTNLFKASVSERFSSKLHNADALQTKFLTDESWFCETKYANLESETHTLHLLGNNSSKKKIGDCSL
jgi:hypothetical protein